MNLKHLLSLGILAAGCFGTSYAAETIPVNGKPVTLDYEKGDISGDFLNGEGKGPNSSITYNLNVANAGNYILYLHTGNKLNDGQLHKYEVSVNDNLAATYELDFNIGGNWNNFIMWPQVVSLPAGNVTLKITQKGDRCYINKDNAPYLVTADYVTKLGDAAGKMDLLHADPSSTLNFTSAAALDVDNSGFGDNNSVLITADDHSDSNGTKKQACYPKTKLLYLVDVAQEGTYPVELTGKFYCAPSGATGNIAEFPVEIRATWKGADLSKNVVTNFTASSDGYSSATGNLNLKKGIYYLELSTTYPDTDLFFLSSMEVGVPADGNASAAPVGKYVPVVSFDEISDVFIGHEFELSGVISLESPQDKIESAVISLNGSNLGNVTLGEGNSFTYKVTDLKALTQPGEYTFTVTVTTSASNGNKYTAKSNVVVNLKKQSFTINAFAGDGGTISFPDSKNTVEEGDDITITVTPNKGYYVESILVDNNPVEFTADENGVAKYTIQNVTANMSVEALFDQITYKVTIEQVQNGSITTNATNDQVVAGATVVVNVIPNEGFEVVKIVVNGSEVDFDVNNSGIANVKIENVESDLSISAEFAVKTYTITTNYTGQGTVVARIVGQETPVNKVEHGAKLEVVITPATDFNIKSITVNGQALSGFNVNGYTHLVESVTADHDFQVVFEDAAGIEGIVADGVSYSIENGGIYVRTNQNCNVQLVDLSGKVLYQASLNNDTFIPTGVKGIAVLRIATANKVINVKVKL